MNAAELRKMVVDALTHANAVGISDHPSREAFLEGQEDISLDDLEIDSLAAMEFCIYLELNHGIEITPDELEEVISVEEIAGVVRKCISD